MRLPPTCRSERAVAALKDALLRDPPYGARVRFDDAGGADGWNAPPLDPNLHAVLEQASRAHFGAGVQFMGEGGTIPFMHMLGTRFPRAQFVVTGVLGPGSNAHGPNEFLHLGAAEKLSCCVADVLAHSR
jgi:acetylornithine deacetylase/succinyl-diaminopimelate desuccinylase-like protein